MHRTFVLLVALGSLALVLSGCVRDHAPIAVLHVPTITGPAPLDVTYDLSYSRDPDGDAIAYELDFGDESPPVEGDTFSIVLRHTFDLGGEFTSRLTVTDARGASGHAEVEVTVSEEGPPAGIEVGMTAPDFAAHRTDEGTFALSQTRGLVVLLDFWGAWCSPCVRNMPHLQDLYDRFGDEGLVVVLASTDVLEETSVDFLEQNGYADFISLWEPGGKAGSPITQLYGVATKDVGIPRTFLLDRQGVIRYVGHPADLAEDLIEGLL